MLYRLPNHVLLNHITNGYDTQVVSATYPTDAIHMIESVVVLLNVCDSTTQPY